MDLARRIVLTFALSGIMVAGAIAGGFQLNEHGARAMAQGGAFTARAYDGSAIYFNPAGLAFQDRASAYVGGTLIMPITSFFGPLQYNTNQETDAPAQYFTPINAYLTLPTAKGLTVGVGVNNPFGLGSKWDENWAGRYLTTNVALQTYFFNQSLGYQVLDNLAVGAGFSYVVGSVEIDRAVSIPLATASGDPRVNLNLKGNGVGWNVGLLYKYSPEIALGASFRGKIKMSASGIASFKPMYYELGLPAGTVSTTIHLPATGFVGITYTPKDEPYEVEADYQYVGWSSYNELAFTFESNGSRSVQPKNYKDTYILRVGGEYKMNKDLRLRAGFYYDHTAVDAAYVDPILPDANRNGYSVGVGYNLTDNLSVDFAYMLLKFQERKAENTITEVSFDGTYRTTAHLISVDFGYTF